MSETNIAWTDFSFNIVIGCTKIDPGCANCYAETMSKRMGRDVWGPGKPRDILSENYWNQPLKWNKKAAAGYAGVLGLGYPLLVFCSSMADVWEDHETVTQQRARLWPLIRATPNLHWQLLTKRADRIAENLPEDWGNGYLNVWLGVSVSEPKGLWRIMDLRKIPAKVRFVSYEPSLAVIGSTIDRPNLAGIDWVISGGESGPNFRKDDPRWHHLMWNHCSEQGVAYFYKQSAALRPGNRPLNLPQQFPNIDADSLI